MVSTNDETPCSDATWRALALHSAERYGTPCYLSRWRPVLRQVESLERQLHGINVKSWLSFKTHPVPALARAWIDSGRGVEAVSEAEFLLLQSVSCPTDRLLLNGVAKHTWLGRYDAPGLRVHFDSLRELDQLLPAAARGRWRVGLRCQVPSERDRHDARFRGQFGLSTDEVEEAARSLERSGVALCGMHFHMGQGALHAGDYAESIAYLVGLCLEHGLAPEYIDAGGSIHATGNIAESCRALSSAFEHAARQLPTLRELWLENGRFVTETSAVLIVRVLDVKARPDARYLICDGGRTNHALDADNGAHSVWVLPRRHGSLTLTAVVGPTCMTDDVLLRAPLPEDVEPGDLIVWRNAGAYHLPWETRFSHGLCAVVWANDEDTLTLARAREGAGGWTSPWTLPEENP